MKEDVQHFYHGADRAGDVVGGLLGSKEHLLVRSMRQAPQLNPALEGVQMLLL